MDLKLPKMLCNDSKQHHVMFHELNSVSSLICIAQNVRFEIPYKDLYFETPFLMIFKYYAWASYDHDNPNPALKRSTISFLALKGKGLLVPCIRRQKFTRILKAPKRISCHLELGNLNFHVPLM